MKAILLDPEEEVLLALRVQINSHPAERAALVAQHGQVWNPAELKEDFTVLAFRAPLAVVRRKSDSKLGSLFFQDHPRYFFGFQEDE